MAAVASVTRVSDPYTNALLGDYKWASGNLTYSFPASASAYESPYGSNEPGSFGALNATQQNAARAAFANYAAVANVTFSELTGASAGGATLRLAMSDAPSTAWAYLPSTAAEGGDVWFNKSYYNNPVRGNYANTTFLHEIGHTLGLEHPHSNGMPVDRDSMEFSVMSYRSYVGAPLTGYTNESWGYAQTLMMYDIAALQHLYGANFNTNSGNNTYSWSPTTGQMFVNGIGQATAGGNRIFQTLWDGGGVDTYDFSNYTTNLSIDLRPGQWSTVSSAQLARLHYDGSQIAEGNIANALQYNGDVRSLIENAVGGSGSDTIIGNAANNWFRGNGGNDVIDGGAGQDRADFSGLFRKYVVGGNLAERSVSSAAEGNDILRSVEIATFVDGTLISDVTLNAAVVYRMYDAAFNRSPDALGLNSWITSLSNGMTTTELAANFLSSQEFTRAYGSLNNSDFVRQLYQFVLDREPDQAGHQYWTAGLDRGSFGRKDVLVGFSESPEHIEMLRRPVETGIWDINENAAAAARLYYVALDRAPDAAGLLGWKQLLDSGTPLADVADHFAFSPEFQERYGTLSNRDFVEQLYVNALDRMPDADGLAGWTNALNSGMERGDVVVGFSESLEHQLKTLPLIDHGIFVV